MPSYVFKCTKCPHTYETVKSRSMAEGPGEPPVCPTCDTPMKRNYKAEAAGISIPDTFRAINPATGAIN
jgi:putative FmdB family regulatory protein